MRTTNFRRARMSFGSGFINDGSDATPRLSVYLNLDNLVDLRTGSVWPGLEGLPRYEHLLADGFEGVQLTTDDSPPAGAPLPHCGVDRINTTAEADSIAGKHAERGDSCITVHVGWGLEDNDEVFRLIESILAASDRHRLPIFIETHRATITQDLWRTIQLIKKFPEIRFNGDFSHYYCGQELAYGDWASKLAFMQPILDRVGFIHGRIANPGCMQVPIGADLTSTPREADGVINYLDHFKDLWTNAMLGFIRNASPGDVLIFAPELLSGAHYYARKFPDVHGQLAEESDRYAEALLYRDLARACFAEARQLASGA
ncbi:MAG TPA: hypothetical protein VFW30_06615 [Bryocella sp.]|nr:hypothetical protein [Bryocella sp.]